MGTFDALLNKDPRGGTFALLLNKAPLGVAQITVDVYRGAVANGQLLPAAVAGMPAAGFSGTLFPVHSFGGHRSEITTQLGHALSPLVFNFNPWRGAAIGDVLDLTGTEFGGYAKALNRRFYPSGVQCDLQRTPYEVLAVWVEPGMTADGEGNVEDAGWTSGGTALVAVEPMSDESKMYAFGTLNGIGANLYTLKSLDVNTVVIGSDGTAWKTESESKFYPLINDYVAPARSIFPLPVGVTA